MDRRWAGALILVVALVAALIGVARTKAIAGSPVTTALPGAPTVGDCLVDPIPASGGQQQHLYIGAVIRPCTGARFGEVTMVLHGIPPSPDPQLGTSIDPFVLLCRTAGYQYLGFTTSRTGYIARVAELWLPFLVSVSVPVAPRTTWREDPPWVACVLTGYALNGHPVPTYQVSARDAVRSGRLPGGFAVCAASDGTHHCDRPHRSESFGFTGPLHSPPTRDQLLSGCRELAIIMTGIPDPTADDRLVLRVEASSAGQDSSGRDAVSYSCVLAAADGLELTGPLLGVADGPLPVR